MEEQHIVDFLALVLAAQRTPEYLADPQQHWNSPIEGEPNWNSFQTLRVQ